jgi:antitoxin (DNA-binding transcriptional repressor) of toxin-antitoxin stability system
MLIASLEEAQYHFIDLISRLDQGEEIIISRHNAAKIKLVLLPELPKKRQFGQFRGQIEIADDFDEPLPDSFWLSEQN